jgi:hypothetical protein
MAGKLRGKTPCTAAPGKTKGLIFGESGIGKTWFTLGFPAPYYIDTEGGAKGRQYQERLLAAGGAYMGPEDGALDFDAVINEIKLLATETHGYKTLVIDSITKLFQICIANEQERLGDKDAFGASKKPAVGAMRRLINWVGRLDMNVWFVAHEVAEWGKNESTGQREEVGKIPDVWDKLVYELDLGIRVIRRGKVYPSIGVVHKSRLTGFPLGETFKLDYPTFAERYGKGVIEAAPKAITLISEENANEIARLVAVLKVPETECEKVLTKAAASSWAELSEEHGAKTLAWLNNKIKGGDEK